MNSRLSHRIPMAELLHLSPQGHLLLDADAAARFGEEPRLRRVIRAFERSTAEGLFALAAEPGAPDDPSLAYFRGLSARFLQALCRAASAGSLTGTLELPSEDELALLALNAPPLRGAEYLNPEVLKALWDDLEDWSRSAIEASGLATEEWIRKRAPQWRHVGRVCFHLAENKSDPEYPFAFLATYAPRVGQSGKAQFQPLGQALREYAGARNKRLLVQLLEPVQRASQRLPFVEELVATGDLYHPTAWSAAEAYTFLKAIPILEDCGLLTRVPNWWQARRRPAVSVSVGEARPGALGLNALLSFKVVLALGDQTLGTEELDALLQNADGLARLNGQWVEVDRNRLEQALEHWRRIEEQAAEGGISFAQGMRLLAGTSASLAAAESEDELDAVREWTVLQAEGGLAETLAQLRDPRQLEADRSHPGLCAQLRPYQQTGFAWLKLLTRLGLGACLADDMGLGKTIQVIALLLALKREAEAGDTSGDLARPALLVLPASLLANWKSEFAKFAPSLRLCFVHSSEADKASLDRLAADPDRALAGIDLVMTTYGMLLRQNWLSQRQWSLVVVDEAQAIKNPGSRQTRAVKRLKGRARIALTGTPVENKLGDLWSIMDFACPGLLGNASTFAAYVKRLANGREGGYGGLRKLVAPYILRRLKTDKSVISDLPDKIELKAYCALAPQQAALYQATVKELQAALSESEGMQRRGLVLSFLMRFKQICNHPSHALGDGVFEPQASGKFARLKELCEEIAERQEKVLVFTQFREMAEPLEAFLAGLFGQPGLILHGGTRVSQRQKLVEAFQAEAGPPFFVLSLKAGGSGLNLTAASHVIHFDRWWNPAVENQATDRAFRIGQKRKVLVHKFVSRGTIEEKVDRLIADKLALSDRILEDGSETSLTELSDDELLQLVSLDIRSAS